MSNKALRIMIADREHSRRVAIERDFNKMGYFAIAPASDLEEVLALLEYGTAIFDLVLINAQLAHSDRFNMLTFRLNNFRVRHSFIYNVPELRITMLSKSSALRMTLSPLQQPNDQDIKGLLLKVDPPVLHKFNPMLGR
ncbi:hypothetical protein PS865_04484 [Pseudomonas fluorescens]|uniref:response regulator n=1 Tax=Pseudomonas fluorescens TaxID=294 RepID=UPI001240F7E6|nr:response regulator [Pseudomonas fluorescens]VVP33458.1 hypothetical protein PS865_04484 [Pseudomonas fluorescens]